MICKECGNELIANAAFCTNCGARVDTEAQTVDSDKTVVLWDGAPQQPMQDNGATVCCPNCGSNNEGDMLFCIECGGILSEIKQKPQQPVIPVNPVTPIMTMTPPPVQQQQPAKKMKAPKQMKQSVQYGKPSGKKKIPIIIGAVAAVVVLLIGAVFVISGLSEKNIGSKLVYLKDNEMYIAEGGKYTPTLITEDFFEDKKQADGIGISDFTYRRFSRIQYTENERYMFYPQNNEDGVYDLYYKEAGSGKEGTKLESGVDSYKVYSEELILYRKNDKLYCGNLKERKKLASDIGVYGISENGKYIYWDKKGDEGYDYYFQDASLKKDSIKIKEVSSMVSMNDDYSEIYYKSDGTLYLMKNLQDKVKISSDVERAYKLGGNDSEKLYYIKLEEENVYTYDDMVEDDVDEDYDYINKALEKCYLNINEYTVCSYSAKTDKSEELATICGEIDNDNIMWYADRSENIFLYGDIDVDAMDKVKISDIIDYFEYDNVRGEFIYHNFDDVVEMIEFSIKEQASWYMQTEEGIITVNDIGEFFEVFKVAPEKFLVNSVTKEVYMSVGYDMGDEGYTYDLYVIPYSKNKTECKLITNDLYYTMYNTKQGVWYLCDVDEDGGTLFLNGIEMDDDVYPYGIVSSEEEIYYIKDINSDHNKGTLCVNKNGKVTEIAEDVAVLSAVPVDNGCVAYLADYNYKKAEGDLFVFNGRKNIAIDTEVSAIMH